MPKFTIRERLVEEWVKEWEVPQCDSLEDAVEVVSVGETLEKDLVKEGLVSLYPDITHVKVDGGEWIEYRPNVEWREPEVSLGPHSLLEKIKAWVAAKPSAVSDVAPLLTHYDKALDLLLELREHMEREHG